MERIFVIRNFRTGQYYSVNDMWDDVNMYKPYNSKEEALDDILLNGLDSCIIEEVINLNQNIRWNNNQ